MNRLSMFDHRFAALETQKDTHGPHKSQVSRDMRSKLIEELIFNDLHSSVFTNGINTPHGSTNSVPFGQSMAAPMPAAPLTASEDISFALGQKQRAASDMPSHYSHKPLSHHVPGIATCTQYGGTQTPVQYAPSQVPATQYAPTQPPPTQYSQQAGAASQVRSVGPLTERRPSAQGDLIWGSEVELPHPNEVSLSRISQVLLSTSFLLQSLIWATTKPVLELALDHELSLLRSPILLPQLAAEWLRMTVELM